MALELSAKTRTITGKAVVQLRRAGEIPGVVYGHGFANVLVTVSAAAFKKVYAKSGASSLIDLVVEEKKVPVLVQEVATDPVRDDVIHIDFHQVRTDEKITADIPLKFTGESAAVKDLKGVLVRALAHLKVQCFPQDLVAEITVSIGPLKTFADKIRVKDLTVPAAIQVLDKPETIVANVAEPRSEEEAMGTTADMAAAEKAAIEGQTKVEKKDKKAGEEEEAEAGDKKAEAGAKKTDAPKKK